MKRETKSLFLIILIKKNINMKKILLFLKAIFRFLAPLIILVVIVKVLIFWFQYIKEVNNTETIKIVLSFIEWSINFAYNATVINFRDDIINWIIVLVVLLVIIYFLFFYKKAPLGLLGNMFKWLVWDFLFSFTYLSKILLKYLKSKNFDVLEDSLNTYIKLSGFEYFKSNKIWKELLLLWGNDYKTYNLLNTYFQNNFDSSIISFKIKNWAKVITLHRSKSATEKKIKEINENDLLHNIELNKDEYNLRIELVWHNIKIIITSKAFTKVYKINDYIKDFKPNTMYFGIDEFWKSLDFKLNFSEANHLWIYWTTWSWKSTFTTSLLYSLYLINKNYQFYVLDIKGDFNLFEWLNRIEYWSDKEDIIKLTKKICDDMDKTKELFNKNKARNYNEYKWGNSFIKPRFVFIEEFSSLLSRLDNKEEKEEVIKNIKNIALIWRSLGFNLIFSLQVPLISVIQDSEITRNLKSISFNIENSFNSKIFWEKTSYNLDTLDTWVWIFKNKANIYCFKSFLVWKEDLEKLAEENKKEEESKSEQYLKQAIILDKFSLNEALKFGLTRWEFDKLSKDCQNKEIITKSSNNSLVFVKKWGV